MSTFQLSGSRSEQQKRLHELWLRRDSYLNASSRRPTATGLDSLPALVRDCIREWAPASPNNASDSSTSGGGDRFWYGAACARLDYALNQVMLWNATLNYSYTMARFLEIRRNYEQLVAGGGAAAEERTGAGANAGRTGTASPQLRELKRLLETRMFPISFTERLLTHYMDAMRAALTPYATVFESASELDEKRFCVRAALTRDLFRPSLVCLL